MESLSPLPEWWHLLSHRELREVCDAKLPSAKEPKDWSDGEIAPEFLGLHILVTVWRFKGNYTLLYFVQQDYNNQQG